jgi:SulP family sulfate permease
MQASFYYLSEVKGPVMDRLQATEFVARLSGKIYLSHYQAIAQLTPKRRYLPNVACQ